MANTLTVVARLTANPGHAEPLQDALTTLVLAARASKGCKRYVMTRGVDDPNVFILIQEWRNRDVWESHRDGAAVNAFRDAISGDAIASFEIHPVLPVA